MGIKGLMKILEEFAPNSFKETTQKDYSSKIVAIDASMQLYQFLIQIRISGTGNFGQSQLLTNEAGEITSHLQGFFNRTATLIENGIKPVYVFDGKPPAFKDGELSKRKEIKEKAFKELKAAETRIIESTLEEETNAAIADMDKAAKRTVSVTKEQNEDVKKLIKLMGLPIVEAPCEAEAQCAELVKSGKVYATATEDMDALTFASPILLRKMTDSKSKIILEIHLNKVLKELDLNYNQFIDFCILCGCDYCDTIKGIGPKTALKLIKKLENIENIINSVDSSKIPENFEKNLNHVRSLFKTPLVICSDDIELKFNRPNKEEIIKFLCTEKGFNIDRVKKVIDRIDGIDEKQSRIDSFFKKKS